VNVWDARQSWQTDELCSLKFRLDAKVDGFDCAELAWSNGLRFTTVFHSIYSAVHIMRKISHTTMHDGRCASVFLHPSSNIPFLAYDVATRSSVDKDTTPRLGRSTLDVIDCREDRWTGEMLEISWK